MRWDRSRDHEGHSARDQIMTLRHPIMCVWIRCLLVRRLEEVLCRAADRADPVRREILKSCSGRGPRYVIALSGIVDIPADRAYVFTHFFRGHVQLPAMGARRDNLRITSIAGS